MRKDYIKVLFLCLLFFCFYFFIGLNDLNVFGKINNGQDFSFHFTAIEDKNFSEYPPLYHLIFLPFVFNELSFYALNLFLILFFIPLLLFKLTKNFFSVLTYFVLTNLPHLMIFGATFPQALIIIFFLIYLNYRKNFVAFFLFLFLASITHKQGLTLFFAVGLIELIVFFYENFKLKFDQVFCSGGFLIGSQIDSFKDVFAVFTSFVPLPLIYFSRKAFFDSFYFLLICFSFLAGIFFDIRALWLAQIVLSLNFVLPEKKKGFLLLIFFYCLFFLFNFVLPTIKMIALN